MPEDAVWIMIPARGGSRGVPRKNVRLLAGIPLIAHMIRIALKRFPPENIFIITDDDEIAAVSQAEGVLVLREPPTTGLATLDQVALEVSDELVARGAREDDIFLTLQPTCPFLRTERLDEAIAAFKEGAASVLTVVDDRHLGWRLDDEGCPVPDYKERVNRQKLPPQFRESGAIIGCRIRDLNVHGTRIGQPIRLIPVEKEESLDIDDFTDWAVAEHLASRRSIVIRADASKTLGMGHVYRALAIAQELARHKLVLATDSGQPLGASLLGQYPFELVEVNGDAGFLSLVERLTPDLTILDQLDTASDYVNALRRSSGKVVTFEDQGPGALEADLLVSDLYKNLNVPDDRQLTGISNAILAPNFETTLASKPFRPEASHVLVVFGGTDPAHLTERALEALARARFAGHVDVVLGPGAKRYMNLKDYGLEGALHEGVNYMPALMVEADLAISSAGRTITELVSLGVPVLCLCQNEKELTHTHASARYGVINLGLGELVGTDTLAAHIGRLVDSADLRKVLRTRALHETADRSNAAVIRRIMRGIGWT